MKLIFNYYTCRILYEIEKSLTFFFFNYIELIHFIICKLSLLSRHSELIFFIELFSMNHNS